jgi:hypothetical protein
VTYEKLGYSRNGLGNWSVNSRAWPRCREIEANSKERGCEEVKRE